MDVALKLKFLITPRRRANDMTNGFRRPANTSHFSNIEIVHLEKQNKRKQVPTTPNHHLYLFSWVGAAITNKLIPPVGTFLCVATKQATQWCWPQAWGWGKQGPERPEPERASRAREPVGASVQTPGSEQIELCEPWRGH